MPQQDYDNDMTGAIFDNTSKKREGKKDPDRTGSCEIDGTEYWIAGWIKKDKNGRPYLSLAFTEKTAKGNPPSRTPKSQTRDQQRGGFDDMEDDIPF
jgi:hypothetical protein